MNEHQAIYDRSWLLYQQGRIDLAEKELRSYLGDNPDSDWAHALLALCLLKKDSLDEAFQESQTAIGLGPENALNHHVHSEVLLRRKKPNEAEAAIREAIQLDPYNSIYYGQLASIHMEQTRWKEMLDAANFGLEADPGDTNCAKYRSIALVRLGRPAEASETMRGALEYDPDDGYNHANLGWALMEEGQYKEAMGHFREALRLEPNSEYARQGIIHALRAQNVLYRPILRYFLWAQKLKARYALYLFLGSFLLVNYLVAQSQLHPEYAPFIQPVLLCYMIFVVSSWLANPLFNLILLTHPLGRMALTGDEKKTSILVTSCLLCALAFYIGSFWISFSSFASLGVLFSTLPLSQTWDARPGWPRWGVVALGAGMLFMAIFPVFIYVYFEWFSMFFPALLAEPAAAVVFFCVKNIGTGALVSQILSQVLVARYPNPKGLD